MLENVVEIFDSMHTMTDVRRKKAYTSNMESFEEKYGHYITEMLEGLKQSDDVESLANEYGMKIAADAKEKYAVKSKIKRPVMALLNLQVIYYLMPAILRTNDENSSVLCDKLRDAWNTTMNANIDYTDFQTIHDAFCEKIFGIF